LASSLVVATYDQVRLTPRFLAALHLDLFDQPALGSAFFSVLVAITLSHPGEDFPAATGVKG
jgi:hypothetical protein